MMGVSVGTQVATEDLQENDFVIVDRERYLVDCVEQTSGQYAVTLLPTVGSAWVLFVDAEDYGEPMWERL